MWENPRLTPDWLPTEWVNVNLPKTFLRFSERENISDFDILRVFRYFPTSRTCFLPYPRPTLLLASIAPMEFTSSIPSHHRQGANPFLIEWCVHWEGIYRNILVIERRGCFVISVTRNDLWELTYIPLHEHSLLFAELHFETISNDISLDHPLKSQK